MAKGRKIKQVRSRNKSALVLKSIAVGLASLIALGLVVSMLFVAF